MVDLNHVVLIGRLTRDAELKYTSSGQAVCKFAIAVNRRKKSGDQWVDEPNFFDIVLWGRQGETLNQYLVKGKLVGVDGELRQDRWEQDGQNRSRIEIVAANIQLLGGGNPNGPSNSGYGSSGGRQDSAPANGGTYRSGANNTGGAYGANSSNNGDDHFTDDIPF